MREACCALIATAMLAPSGYGTAGFADDNTAFSLAISILRGAGMRAHCGSRPTSMAWRSRRKMRAITTTSTVADRR
jgi:hypothetical protein